MKNTTIDQLKEKLVVGTKIKIGIKYTKSLRFGNLKAGDVIELIDGEFEYDNGLYTETQSCPSIWNEKSKEFDSIYHLFGNDFENFLDNQILN
ncbi:conserved hypothetical protein [Tenacibaculum litopenaei]|uniref:hypothetical protein n=1 Tax=Tenacibaculum litopenaei TaxID=396016 RepID=UPI0038930744